MKTLIERVRPSRSVRGWGSWKKGVVEGDGGRSPGWKMGGEKMVWKEGEKTKPGGKAISEDSRRSSGAWLACRSFRAHLFFPWMIEGEGAPHWVSPGETRCSDIRRCADQAIIQGERRKRKWLTFEKLTGRRLAERTQHLSHAHQTRPDHHQPSPSPNVFWSNGRLLRPRASSVPWLFSRDAVG